MLFQSTILALLASASLVAAFPGPTWDHKKQDDHKKQEYQTTCKAYYKTKTYQDYYKSTYYKTETKTEPYVTHVTKTYVTQTDQPYTETEYKTNVSRAYRVEEAKLTHADQVQDRNLLRNQEGPSDNLHLPDIPRIQDQDRVPRREEAVSSAQMHCLSAFSSFSCSHLIYPTHSSYLLNHPSVTKTQHVPVTKTNVEDKTVYTTKYKTETKETHVPTTKYKTETEQKCETVKCHPKGCWYKEY